MIGEDYRSAAVNLREKYDNLKIECKEFIEIKEKLEDEVAELKYEIK